MDLLRGWYPGIGEEAVLNGLSDEVRSFLGFAINEDPGFMDEYLLPTLEGLDAADTINRDFTLAFAELELEEAIFGPDPDDFEDGGLGKSLKKKLKKAVKKVKEVHKKIEAKIVPKALLKVKEKIEAPIKKVHEKATNVVKSGAKRAGQFVERAAKSGKLQLALAPFTGGVSLLAHPKVVDGAKKFMAGKYGNIVIGAVGAVLAPFTGGASLAAAAALTAANGMYQTKKAAEEAKKAAKADASQLQAQADQAEAETRQQVDAFYSQNQAWFSQHGITPDKWAAMSLEEKIAVIQAGADGKLQVVNPPASQQGQQSGQLPGLPGSSSAGQASPGGGYGTEGGGGGGGGGYAPAGSPGQQAQPGVAKAGMGELLMPAMIGIGIVAVLTQGKKKGRTRRNPGRRMRRSA